MIDLGTSHSLLDKDLDRAFARSKDACRFRSTIFNMEYVDKMSMAGCDMIDEYISPKNIDKQPF